MNGSGRRGWALSRRNCDVKSCCLEATGSLIAASWDKGRECDAWIFALVNEDRSCLQIVLRLWSVFIFAILEELERRLK